MQSEDEDKSSGVFPCAPQTILGIFEERSADIYTAECSNGFSQEHLLT